MIATSGIAKAGITRTTGHPKQGAIFDRLVIRQPVFQPAPVSTSPEVLPGLFLWLASAMIREAVSNGY